MSFADRIAEALASTNSIALVGDDVRDELYQFAVAWGFRLASVKAEDLATFGEGHELWGSKSRAHWLLMIEDCDSLAPEQEDNLLDLLFDGAPALPEHTLIAAHFTSDCHLASMLNDENVPISFLAKSASDNPAGAADPASTPLASPRGISLAA